MNIEKIHAFLDSYSGNFKFLVDMKVRRMTNKPLSEAMLLAIEKCIPQAPVAPDGKYLVGERMFFLKTMHGNQMIKENDRRISIEDPDVQLLISSPLQYSKAYGRKTGVCGVCHATLTNPESIELGIGPICREKFG